MFILRNDGQEFGGALHQKVSDSLETGIINFY